MGNEEVTVKDIIEKAKAHYSLLQKWNNKEIDDEYMIKKNKEFQLGALADILSLVEALDSCDKGYAHLLNYLSMIIVSSENGDKKAVKALTVEAAEFIGYMRANIGLECNGECSCKEQCESCTKTEENKSGE